MRRAVMHTQQHSEFALPRGWIVLGAALASWVVVAVLWTGTTQLFTFVSSVI